MPLSQPSLHPQLAVDCHLLARAPSGLVLLHRNAVLPWLILVPDTSVVDLLTLPPEFRTAVLADCTHLDQYLRRRWQVTKVNVAALGNLVPQLHLHLVGRRVGDACWPLPVWGHLRETSTYPDREVMEIAAEVSALWPQTRPGQTSGVPVANSEQQA